MKISKPSNPYKRKTEPPLFSEMYELLKDDQKNTLEYVREQLMNQMDCFEDLYYYGTSWGWVPRYAIKRNKVVAALHLLPGLLEGSVSISTIHLELLKKNPLILPQHKAQFDDEQLFAVTKWVTFELDSRKDCDSFLEIAKIKKQVILENSSDN